MSDSVNQPAHYTAGGIECIDALEAATHGLEGQEAFCTANAIKYLWRWKRKNGAEDLKKARWYIERLLSAIEPAPAPTIDSEDPFGVCEPLHEGPGFPELNPKAEQQAEAEAQEPRFIVRSSCYRHQCRCGNGFDSFSEFSTCQVCGRGTQGIWPHG